MLNSVLGLLFSVLGLLLAKTNTTGIVAKVLAVVTILLFVVSLIQCLIAFISSIKHKNIFIFVFGLSGLILSIYGLIRYRALFKLILELF